MPAVRLHNLSAVEVDESRTVIIFVRKFRKIRKILRHRRGDYGSDDAEVCLSRTRAAILLVNGG